MGKVLFALLSATLVMKSCSVGFGGGSNTTSGSPALAVPWVGQENSEYCGPASILMWALYDGVTGLTQTQIGNHIGTSLATGSSQSQIAAGVDYYTRSGRDAGLSYPAGTTDEIGLYYSQEVTSINSGVPFIAFIIGARHAGVARGGSWNYDDSSGLYVWDSVIFQDPISGSDQVYFAGQWTSEDVTHIISNSASQQAAYNYDTYGGRIGLRGSTGTIKQAY
jgi:Peptidase_C39 like family